jgi:hypothetical protein
MNSKSIKIAVVLMIATMFLQMTPAGNPDIALAADGATGSITPGLFNAQYDTPITVLMEGLTVSADYGVAYGDGSGGTVGSIFNFTTGSTQTTMTFTTSFDTTQSSTGDVVTIVYPVGRRADNSAHSSIHHCRAHQERRLVVIIPFPLLFFNLNRS